MQIDLSGRVALITGGSKGLGLATARCLATAGADVALLARGQEALDAACAEIAVTGQRVEGFRCDVTREEDIAAAHAAVVDAFGRVDILINNAGAHAHGEFLTLDDAAWQADLDLKLMAGVRFCRLVMPAMIERRWGRIINVINVFAKAPRAASAPTSVSRAAQMALTKVLAGEGAPFGVLVNAIAVGIIRSSQIEAMHAKSAGGENYEEFSARMARQMNIPMGRLGVADEFANVACFLSSEAASYVTGSVLNVDGGLCPTV